MNIDELTDNTQLTNTPFLLESAESRETKSGDPYVAGELRDATGRIDFRRWESEDHPEPPVVVEVTGTIDSYRGDLQVIIDTFAANDDLRMAEFVEAAHRPAPEMLGECLSILDTHNRCKSDLSGFVRKVCQVRLEDDGKAAPTGERGEALLEMPAARGHHHARLGGLVQHIHSMVETTLNTLKSYEQRYAHHFDRSLLIAACILHDIGKIEEYSGAIGTEVTEYGRRQGHIAIALQWVDQAAAELDVDGDTHDHLRHLILSHHGKKEWGSPVEPQTPEAQLLHQIDMLDSRMDAVLTE
jgi:3'-5' exoribonuclease